MKKLQDILIVLVVILLGTSLLTSGWLAVALAAGAAVIAAVAIFLPHFTKKKK